MKKVIWVLLCLAAITGSVQAQDGFSGDASIGSSEPLYRYDDQERWKHGYLQIMPYYHGWHSFRPYNYHHIFNQSQTASGWGMSPVMPYSQQFWHKYENMTDLSQGHHNLVSPNVAPVQEDSHYPTPINPGMINQGMPTPASPNMLYPQPQMQQMQYEVPAQTSYNQAGYGQPQFSQPQFQQMQYQQPQFSQPQYAPQVPLQGPGLAAPGTQLQGYLNQGY